MAAISAPMPVMRARACALRAGRQHPAYAPSVLRNTPGIRGMLGGSKVLVPLPELMLSRTTSGIYYDVIGGGAKVRNEIGKHFEDFTFDLLSRKIPALTLKREYRYRFGKNLIDSPDLIASRERCLAFVIECKATKMSFDSKFTLDRLEDENRGFDEIAKGVFQIWRYLAHARAGLTSDKAVAEDAIGVLLTLDPWVPISFTTKGAILDRARRMVREKAREIADDDMKPIAIYSVEILEDLVLHQSDEVILDQFRRACREGPSLGEVEPDLTSTAVAKPYPFRDEIDRVLPWWGLMNRVGTAAG